IIPTRFGFCAYLCSPYPGTTNSFGLEECEQLRERSRVPEESVTSFTSGNRQSACKCMENKFPDSEEEKVTVFRCSMSNGSTMPSAGELV
ncbi:hypothetical protein BaRGS_00015955, partial [Batillaria attramentaria]